MAKKKRLVPARIEGNSSLNIIRDLLRKIDFDLQYEKQELTRSIKALDQPLKLYFLRESSFLHFSFEGFGDLLGHQLTFSHDGSVIASAYINHTGDATLCLDQDWLPSDFRLTISATSVG